MRLVFLFFAFLAPMIANADFRKLQCDIVTENGMDTGEDLVFTSWETLVVEPNGAKRPIFDENHLCGIKNDLPNSTLEHIFLDISERSRFRIDILGDTQIKRPNYQNLPGTSYELVYGEKETSSNFGWFRCGDYGLNNEYLRHILMGCKEVEDYISEGAINGTVNATRD